MTSKASIFLLLKAVLAGTLMPLAILTGIGLLTGSSDIPLLLDWAPIILAISFPANLVAALLLGLPLSKLLTRTGLESRAMYVGVGAVFGLFLPLVSLAPFSLPAALALALFGASSGATMALVWWRGRCPADERKRQSEGNSGGL